MNLQAVMGVSEMALRTVGIKVLFGVLLLSLLSACGQGSKFADLDRFMASTREAATHRGAIDPIPVFRPYQAFTYSATAKRAPFDVPIDVTIPRRIGGPRSDVKPDKTRSKEYLEQFNFEALSMVGSLEQRGKLWILIDDKKGLVHRVSVGDYLGRNHGKIVEVSESQLSVVEIVSSGNDSWIERPRTIKLRESGDGS